MWDLYSGRGKVLSHLENVRTGCGAQNATYLMDTKVKNG